MHFSRFFSVWSCNTAHLPAINLVLSSNWKADEAFQWIFHRTSVGFHFWHTCLTFSHTTLIPSWILLVIGCPHIEWLPILTAKVGQLSVASLFPVPDHRVQPSCLAVIPQRLSCTLISGSRELGCGVRLTISPSQVPAVATLIQWLRCLPYM